MMKITKFITETALLFACYLSVCAQTASISNIWSEVQDQHIAVHYTITTWQPVNVGLQYTYSIDQGRTWFNCKSVTGDLQSQTTGNKTIIWDCWQDGVDPGSLSFLSFNVVADKLPETQAVSSSNQNKSHVFGLDAGIGARKANDWGTFLDLGLRYTYHFLPSIAWDMVNLKLQGLVKSPAFENCLIQAMTGLRAYTPELIKDRKGYGCLKVGFGLQPYLETSGFTYELEIGIKLTKTLSAGLVYNSQKLQGEEIYDKDNNWKYDSFNVNCTYIGLRLSLNF